MALLAPPHLGASQAAKLGALPARLLSPAPLLARSNVPTNSSSSTSSPAALPLERPRARAVSARGLVLTRAVKADATTELVDTAALQIIAEVTRLVDTSVSDTIKANTEAAKHLAPTPRSELRTKVMQSIRKVSKGLLERETEVHGGCRGACWSVRLRCMGDVGGPAGA